jgi:hypothetical protein
MNPFLAFCLYVAARVFVQYLKFRPKDEQMIASLQFLLAAMNALKKKNPLTESFLLQLDVDLEGMGIDVGQRAPDYSRFSGGVVSHTSAALVVNVLKPKQCEVPANMDSLKCSPIFEIRDSQSQNSDLNKFGGGESSSDTGKGRSSNTPGPPFHLAQASLNLDVDPNSFGYLSSASGDSPQYQLPNRNRTTRPGPPMGLTGRMVTSLSPGSEEGRSPNMNNDQHSTRSNSYKDSSSHTSFTPPSIDDSQQQQPRQNSVNTPSSMTSASSLQTPSAIDPSNNGNFYQFDTSFSNFQPGFLGQAIDDNMGNIGNYSMQSSWEMSGIEITSGSGMTPMADQPWSQMLEGIQDWGGDLTTSQYDASLPGRRTS